MFLSFFSTFGEGLKGYSFLFASMHGRQTASVLRLLALFALLREILFLEQRVCFHILEMCFCSGVFLLLYFLGINLGMGFAAFFLIRH